MFDMSNIFDIINPMIIRNGIQILTELAELEKVISIVEEMWKEELTEEELEIILRYNIKSVLEEKKRTEGF